MAPPSLDLSAVEPAEIILYLDPSRDAMEAILDFSRSLHVALGDAAGRVRWFHPSVVSAPLLTFSGVDLLHVPWLRSRLEATSDAQEAWEVTYRGVYLTASADESSWHLALGVDADFGVLDRFVAAVADERPYLADRARREPEVRLPLALMARDATSASALSADPERVVGQEFTTDFALAIVVAKPGGERRLKRLASVPFARR